uniref:BZIP domain-containing protein n=1 Tax=Setaria italica TaxID=4555 RepID=K3YJX7_SETIT
MYFAEGQRREVKGLDSSASRSGQHGGRAKRGMEPERGDAAELLVWGTTGAGNNDDGAAAACLCPAAVAAAPGSVFPRHALEQEMLRRGDLQLQGGVGDRRRERKMKNRESAARSRARRYAYVNELEKEVSALRAENEELRKLCEELKEAAEAPAKKANQRLQRTSSATF